MPLSPTWRDRFVDLAAELCRARGEAEPIHHADAHQALQLSLWVDGMRFDALHPDIDDETGDRIVLQGRLGPLPGTPQDALWRAALAANLALCRQQAGAFGWDESREELVFSAHRSLGDMDGTGLLRDLGDIAAHLAGWRQASHASSA
ncbi:MAG TPA: CesT family type III secretion system chaperone [Hydrogenophaga sp.]|uniref:CesT family type III secretion system chaperone n=1 Tax=Hydrogenophaga sp. TaxID=1904254 RepID=UPI002CA11E5F|nr:CesT family type III secretion system chaperone [Hydrogenophaga sp.]HSX93533.1 CesT family type III secretion system chaperone [Hydrogenophaga sp.]